MSCILADLHHGATEAADDGPSDSWMADLREKVNMEKFNRGRHFFIRNLSQCLSAMMFSLICGLSIINLLDVLVATDQTSKPRQSFFRYIRTSVHVMKWHYGNIWEQNSSAQKSIKAVRRLHYKSRKFMESKTSGKSTNPFEKFEPESFSDSEIDTNNQECRRRVFLNQYDMSLVQCGFMGLIVMYPERFGIWCSKHDLDDYVYFWRWIGYMLGIKETNNICLEGYGKAYDYCKTIEQEILFPALETPPAKFYPMAKAYTDGVNQVVGFSFQTPDYIIAFMYEMAGRRYTKHLSLSDRLRLQAFKFQQKCLIYVPGFAWLFNKVFETIFGCKHMT